MKRMRGLWLGTDVNALLRIEPKSLPVGGDGQGHAAARAEHPLALLGVAASGVELALPTRPHEGTEVLFVLSGAIRNSAVDDPEAVLGAGTIIALGKDTDDGHWASAAPNTAVLSILLRSSMGVRQFDLTPHVEIVPEWNRLDTSSLEWTSLEGGGRKATLAAHPSLMTFFLMHFPDGREVIPPRRFPGGEAWVMLWGGATIESREFRRGHVGVIEHGSEYGPRNVQPGTLVLVFTPRVPVPLSGEAMGPSAA